MNNADKQTMDLLREELAKSAETAKVPLRLQKDSVVAMLKNSDADEKDFSSKTGNKRNIVMLRRITAAAAVIAVIIVAALNADSGKVNVIKTDSFYQGYKGMELVKSISSYEELENVVKEILGIKPSEVNDKQPDGDASGKNDSVTDISDSLIEGYEEYVPQAEIVDNKDTEGKAENAPEVVTEGVVSYGDFKADIVKTDGKYLYIATTGVNEKTNATLEQIKIVKAVPAGEMQEVSTITLSDGTESGVYDECIEIYLKNNRLIALLNRYTPGGTAADSKKTIAVHYDISDPTSPKELRTHIQDGKYVASGLYGNGLSIVTEKPLPSISELEAGAGAPSFSVNGKVIKLNPEEKKMFVATNGPESSYLFITVTDITDYQMPVGKLIMLGCGKDIYCSDRAVAITRTFVSVSGDEDDKLTEIFRFNISDSSIAFSGSYIVKGSVVGGISFDEKNGYLRAATAVDGSSNFYLLNEKMEFVSGLTEVMPGKNITGVKFIGTKAYFVAGDEKEKTLIVDFSDPKNPVSAGRISTESFSKELYAMSDTALIGIDTAKDEPVKISLFDVSNPEKPKTASEYTLEGEYSLPGADDTRRVVLDKDKKIFGLPVVRLDSATGTESSAYILFDVSNGELSPIGIFNHATSYTGDAAVRGICIGNTLYTVSGESVVAFSIEDGTVISSLTIRQKL